MMMKQNEKENFGIYVNGSPIEAFKFPGGEIHINIEENLGGPFNEVTAHLWSSDSIMALLLTADALKRQDHYIWDLYIPYFPYARQDRVNSETEALSLRVMTDLINGLNLPRVTVVDPHSDVLAALLNNVTIINPNLQMADLLEGKMIICPDAGAEKRIQKMKRPYILATKVRDTSTGEITGTKVHVESLADQDCIIVDDICDGGRTFIELAKVLREKGARSVDLVVSHGIFSKGLDVFAGIIDNVYAFNYTTKSHERVFPSCQ